MNIWFNEQLIKINSTKMKIIEWKIMKETNEWNLSKEIIKIFI